MDETDIAKMVVHSVSTGLMSIVGAIAAALWYGEWTKARDGQDSVKIADLLRRLKLRVSWEVFIVLLLILGWVASPISFIALLIVLACCGVALSQLVTEYKQNWTKTWFTPFFIPHLKFLFKQPLTKEDILEITDQDILWAIAKRIGRETYVKMFSDREFEVDSGEGARLLITWGELWFLETQDINGTRVHRVSSDCESVKEAKLYLFGYMRRTPYSSRNKERLNRYEFVLET